jgi:hypothetical protein
MIFELVRAEAPRHLVEPSGLNSFGVLATLFELEGKGIIRQFPEKQFCRVLLLQQKTFAPPAVLPASN